MIYTTIYGLCIILGIYIIIRLTEFFGNILNKFLLKKKLSNILKDNIFIISDYKCNCIIFKKFKLYKCNNCCLPNLINFENIDEVMVMFKKINKNEEVNLIIHTEGGTSCCADAIAYLFTSEKLNIHTNVPEYAQSAGTVIALCGNKIHCNWYSLFSPVDTQLDYVTSGDNEEELTFSAKHIHTLTNKDNNLDKLQALEAKDHFNEDLHILNKILINNNNKDEIIKKLANSSFSHEFNITFHDMKKMGLPVDLNIDSNITEIFDIFKKLN